MTQPKKSKYLLMLLAFTAMLPCAHGVEIPPDEADVTLIPLAGAAAERGAELSGLAWWHDQLLMLPQYPRDGIYRLSEKQIAESIDDPDAKPLTPARMPFGEGDLRGRIPGFQGYEAIAVRGDDCWFAIEAHAPGCIMSAWIVRGSIVSLESGIQLHPETAQNIPFNRQHCNMACEALIATDDRIIALYEANGEGLGKPPEAFAFTHDLAHDQRLSFPYLAYRLTDAANMDENGGFYVMNYLWAGDRESLGRSEDALQTRWGRGATHAGARCVERLVPLKIDDAGIVFSEKAPVQFRLDPGPGRNWEGVAHWKNGAFLVVSDAHPATLFAVVSP
jgi:hypothetical protein